MSRTSKLFKIEIPTSTNRDGFAAYERSLEEQYLQLLLCNTISNTFYSEQQEMLKESETLHNKIALENPEFMARALVFARNNGFMRLQPIYGLVKLSKVNTDLFEKVFDKVILIPSDLQDFMAILQGQGRGQGGRAVKRAVARFLNTISEYWAIKYNGRGRGYSLGDIIATTHPKPTDKKQSNIFNYVMGKETDLSELKQISAYENLKKGIGNAAELIREAKLPHEVVTGVVKADSEVWNALAKDMPIFALLRNLNALERHNVLDNNKDAIEVKLTNAESIKKAKILPFRLLTAFKEVSKNWVRDTLRMALENSINNLPEIKGKTAILLDRSGSMSGQNLLIASIFAIGMYKKADAEFISFDTSAWKEDISKVDSVLSQAERIDARGGTDTAAPIQALIHNKIYADNIIMITDEQQNTGRPMYHALKEYRQKINNNAKMFIVDISGYRNAMTPTTDKLTHYIYGWSDIVPEYISKMSNGFGSMINTINETVI